MQLGFWQERWKENRIRFHQEHGNAQLQSHLKEFSEWWQPTSRQWRVFVPLCGKSKDLSWLASHGHEVIGVEFIEDAALRFFDEAGVTPEKRELTLGKSYRYEKVTIIVADFFALTPSQLGPIDMVYDRAALVAVEPERRAEYARQLGQMLAPGGGLFLVTFEHDMGSGPPFSVDNTQQLFCSSFEIKRIIGQDILDEEPRFREVGATTMLEVVWFARRK